MPKRRKGSFSFAPLLLFPFSPFLAFLVARIKNLQDIPEQKRDAGKERKRRRDVLVGAILMQHV